MLVKPLLGGKKFYVRYTMDGKVNDSLHSVGAEVTKLILDNKTLYNFEETPNLTWEELRVEMQTQTGRSEFATVAYIYGV